MKILFLINSLGGGGAERVLAHMTHLLAEDHQIRILAFNKSIAYDYAGDVAFIRKRRGLFGRRNSLVWRLKQPLLLLKNTFMVWRHIRHQRPDRILSFLDAPNIINLLLNRDAYLRVCTFKNSDSTSFLTRIAIRLLFRRARRIICVSQAVKHSLTEGFGVPESLLTTITNPVDTTALATRFQQHLPEWYQQFTRQPTLVLLGRLDPVKNPFLALEALALLGDAPGFQLIIAGEGKLNSAVRQKIEQLGLSSRVKLIPFQDGPHWLFRHALGLLSTSRWEGFPNVIAEALASDVPVIATDCPGGSRQILAPELTLEEPIDYPYRNSNGLLCRQQPEDIANAIEDLFSYRQSFRPLQRGRDFSLSHFKLQIQQALDLQAEQHG